MDTPGDEEYSARIVQLGHGGEGEQRDVQSVGEKEQVVHGAEAATMDSNNQLWY